MTFRFNLKKQDCYLCSLHATKVDDEEANTLYLNENHAQKTANYTGSKVVHTCLQDWSCKVPGTFDATVKVTNLKRGY